MSATLPCVWVGMFAELLLFYVVHEEGVQTQMCTTCREGHHCDSVLALSCMGNAMVFVSEYIINSIARSTMHG